MPTIRALRNNLLSFLSPDKRGRLNGSAQHWLEVYSQESRTLKSFAGVDLNAVLPSPGPIEHGGTRRFS